MWRNVAAAIGIVAVSVAAAIWVASPPEQDTTTGTGGPRAVSHAAALRTFGACEDLTDWLGRHASAHVGPWGIEGGWVGGSELLGGAVALDGVADAAGGMTAASPSAERAAAPAFSGTNVQEVGVDEPDTVKTDGTRLFTVRDGRLLHVDLTGDEPRVVASVAVGEPQEQPSQAYLLLAEDRLLVSWESWAEHTMFDDMPASGDAAMSRVAPGWSSTEAHLFDVTGQTPRLLESASLDGILVSGRLHGDTARLVLRNVPARLPLVAPHTGEPRDLEAATRANVAAVVQATPSQWLPWMSVTDRTGSSPVTSERPMTRCEDVHHTGDFSGLGSLDVLTVPLGGSFQDAHATSILTGAEVVYASTERLYVTTYAWPERQPGPLPMPGIEPALGAPAPPPEFDDFHTAVHAFDVTDPLRTDYLGSGEVPGHVLNQFSLSEHEGHLRVATTIGAPWAGGSESGVHVLRLADGALTEVGSVGDLGRGERIYAVRYVGDTGYVVTFRQVDPLYTLDLSDPTAPEVRGELKIPGYSAYLHPVGDTMLLGIGQDATEEGRVLGTQVALFDVSDLTAPRQVAKTVMAEGHSEAEFDHHAFLHWPATGLTVVPVSTWAETPWSGAMAFRVDGTTLERVGEVSHADAFDGAVRDPWEAFELGRITRSIVVGDQLLTLSQEGLLTSDLDTLETRHWLLLR
ncbi:MAG TPA: beta-propeller domain-containing protein [Nitriliruptorales bacterium]